jgi:hypothetical protein
MRITRTPTFSIETLELISHDGQYEYAGPVAELKGSGYAKANMNTANNLSSQYSGQGLGVNASLIPAYNSEINNPIGFGEQALTQMKTEGGQSAAGAQSASQEQARLAAARTGNLASLPSEQDKLARSATQSADENALGLDVANTKAKLAQQQAGLAGKAALGAEDTGAGLNALGLSNQALNEYMQAANWWEQPLNTIIGGGAQVGAAAAGK